MKKFPPKWVDKFENDDEYNFFIFLSRNKQEWRSIHSISNETGLTKEKVEEIISKYFNLGMIFNKPTNDDYWAYWERVPDLIPNEKIPIDLKDKLQRMEK